ncbi:hypothetical protein B0H15DRAFT_917699 [Mycena belliarum]|uniref:Copper acquisition factor BIM1-like domain-containing protein n=1 Tax=Mycena belliarum TaxID=1033014 RepID=A0AAD6XEC8_9AGAR|nr:hypothetical protein B0H15DRAFT_917699 [Mycena belliae]
MLATYALFLASLLALANAHFQLQFPPPRGKFVEDDEPKFCDGYDKATTNRTVFPLTGGFFSLNSEHTSWTAAVNLSTKPDPAAFSDFASPIVPFFKLSGEGLFCLPLNLLTADSGLKDGQNVTVQIVFDGGDGSLFQCADLTLSSTAKIASDISCTNGTATAGGGSSAASGGAGASRTSSAPGGAATSPNAAAPRFESGLAAVLLGVLGMAATVV